MSSVACPAGTLIVSGPAIVATSCENVTSPTIGTSGVSARYGRRSITPNPEERVLSVRGRDGLPSFAATSAGSCSTAPRIASEPRASWITAATPPSLASVNGSSIPTISSSPRAPAFASRGLRSPLPSVSSKAGVVAQA